MIFVSIFFGAAEAEITGQTLLCPATYETSSSVLNTLPTATANFCMGQEYSWDNIPIDPTRLKTIIGRIEQIVQQPIPVETVSIVRGPDGNFHLSPPILDEMLGSEINKIAQSPQTPKDNKIKQRKLYYAQGVPQ